MKMTWKQDKLDYMEFMFGKYFEEFVQGDYTDDRRVFVNTYKMIVEALQTLEDEPKVFIKCAINHAMDEDINLLKDILERF